MRRTARPSSHLFQRTCPRCDSTLLFASSPASCDNCDERARIFFCTGPSCKFSEKVCPSCEQDRSGKSIKPRGADYSHREITEEKRASFYAVISILFVVFIGLVWYLSSKSHEDVNENVTVTQIRRLKSHYISQKNETWYHLLSVLEQKIPSVKSITFLHGEDRRTLNCLTSELVSLYTTSSQVKVEEITFSLPGSKERDYGFFLKHYHSIVEKFRVLVTDLNEVPGDVARLFHSLCDEESSDIKPSLFIFTLRYDKKTAQLKPLERATTILKEAWGNLPHNEIFPLLSRIVKNVVDVVPEQKVDCLL